MNRCNLPGSGEEVSSGFSYITILNQNGLPFNFFDILDCNHLNFFLMLRTILILKYSSICIKKQVAFIHDVRFIFPALMYLQLRYD